MGTYNCEDFQNITYDYINFICKQNDLEYSYQKAFKHVSFSHKPLISGEYDSHPALPQAVHKASTYLHSNYFLKAASATQ